MPAAGRRLSLLHGGAGRVTWRLPFAPAHPAAASIHAILSCCCRAAASRRDGPDLSLFA